MIPSGTLRLHAQALVPAIESHCLSVVSKLCSELELVTLICFVQQIRA
jgi:hypothetical protein